MKHTIHDPRLHKLPYPRNLMLAIAKADLIDPNDSTSHKPPVIDVDSELEEFITSVAFLNALSDYELDVITDHYQYRVPLTKIAKEFGCTAENIRSHRNHALNKLLKAYLKVKKLVNEPADELPTLDPKIVYEIKHQFDHATHTTSSPFSVPSTPTIPSTSAYPKPAKNSIKKYLIPRKHKPCIPYKLYIRSNGILYLEIKDEVAQHYIGEFYTYSNSNFSIEGIVVDISIAGILLTNREVKRK